MTRVSTGPTAAPIRIDETDFLRNLTVMHAPDQGGCELKRLHLHLKCAGFGSRAWLQDPRALRVQPDRRRKVSGARTVNRRSGRGLTWTVAFGRLWNEFDSTGRFE